jgi:hypothetical protein
MFPSVGRRLPRWAIPLELAAAMLKWRHRQALPPGAFATSWSDRAFASASIEYVRLYVIASFPGHAYIYGESIN